MGEAACRPAVECYRRRQTPESKTILSTLCVGGQCGRTSYIQQSETEYVLTLLSGQQEEHTACKKRAVIVPAQADSRKKDWPVKQEKTHVSVKLRPRAFANFTPGYDLLKPLTSKI